MASRTEAKAGTPPPSRLDDETLVARAQAGDDEAYNELAARHASPLRRLLYKLICDCEAAKDAVQEALLRAWRNIGRFEGRARFSTWLTRIGINAAYRGMAKNGREGSIDAHEGLTERLPERRDGPPEIVESREQLAAIAKAMAELPPDYRRAVVLRDLEGLSTSEAAEVEGIGERALKSRVHRGRRVLRAQVDSELRDAA